MKHSMWAPCADVKIDSKTSTSRTISDSKINKMVKRSVSKIN